jgi:hypothetical protein
MTGKRKLRTLFGCENRVVQSAESILRMSSKFVVRYMEMYGVSRQSDEVIVTKSDVVLRCIGAGADGEKVVLEVCPDGVDFRAELQIGERVFLDWYVERSRVVNVRELPEVIGWAAEALLSQRFMRCA